MEAGESQEIDRDSKSHDPSNMFFRHYLIDHESDGL